MTPQTPYSDRWLPVSAPSRALALDIQTAANRLALSLGGQTATPHGLKDAQAQVDRLRDLLEQIGDEL